MINLKKKMNIIMVMFITMMMGLSVVNFHYSYVCATNTNYVVFESLDHTNFDLSFDSSVEGKLEYFIGTPDNTSTWTELMDSSTPVTGDKICVRSYSENDDVSSAFISNSFSTKVKVSGNIMSLLDHEHVSTVTLEDNCFSYLFYEDTNLVDASNLSLPASALKQACYSYMFGSCTDLKEVPDLPATTLAESCYNGMFASCTELVSAPALPATSLEESCYEGMFSSCISLVNAPVLPATTLAKSCYREMFKCCDALKIAPDLPATHLEEECYYEMFNECISLEKVPALNATQGKDRCYEGMFYNCTALDVVSAPDTTHNDPWLIPASFIEAANWKIDMFTGCTGVDSLLESDGPVIGKTYYQKKRATPVNNTSPVSNKNTITVPVTNSTVTSTPVQLMTLSVIQKSNQYVLKWSKVENIDGYKIYVTRCGNESFKLFKEITKVNATSLSLKKILSKKVTDYKKLKFYIVAYKIQGNKKVNVAKSINSHIASKKSGFTNVKKLTLKSASTMTLTAGNLAKIKAAIVLENKNRRQLSNNHCLTYRYRSTNSSIAAVDTQGKITAKKSGTCKVYVICKNGLSKYITVNVK